MVRRSVAFAVLALAGLLGGCVTQLNEGDYRPLEPRTFKGNPYLVKLSSHENGGFVVGSVVRAYEEGGVTNVCAAVLIAAAEASLPGLESLVVNPRSTLILGKADGPDELPIQAVFATRYHHATSEPAKDVLKIDWKSLDGACIATKMPWKPAYATDHSLQLYRTTMSFIPVPRRR